MTRKNRARYGLSRTYKVSATAKALRGAMIAALATAGASQSALAADECIVLGQNIQCVGATNDTIDNSELEYPNAPFDLTTVTFATSFNSVVGNWNGVDISVGGNDDLRINNLGSIFIVDDNEDSGDIGNTLYGVRADAIDGGISFNNSDSGTVLVDIDENNWWWNGSWQVTETNGAAVGVDLYGEDFATVTNAGLISAGNSTWDWDNGYGSISNPDAIALRVDTDGDLSVVNQAFGSIYAYSLDGAATAVDLWADYGDITVVNNANIAANGDDWTVGVLTEAHGGDTTVTNAIGAELRVYSEFGDATGVLARSWNGDGNITIDNAGLIEVNGDNWATGVYAETIGGDIAVGNTGDINVRAYDNDATGIGAETKYGAVTIQNDSNINVWGYDQANGAMVANISGYGDVTVGNTGSIQVRQEGNYNNGNNGPFEMLGDATGIGVFQNIAGFYGPNPFMGYGDVSITNSGEIDVRADGGSATAIGVLSTGGDVVVSNAGYGDIYSRSERESAFGIGVAAFGSNITVTNGIYAEMFVTAEGWNSGYGDAVGVAARAKYGAVDVNNAGEMFVNSWDGDAYGIQAFASGNGMGPFSVGLLPGDINVVNSGLIDVSGDDDAFGIDARTYGGNITVTNTGTIDAFADTNNGFGIRAESDYGTITVVNGGLIDVYADEDGWGIRADTYANGGSADIIVTNTGRIEVEADDEDAFAIDLATYEGGNITVTNSGTLIVRADEDTTGIDASVNYTGNISITNSGFIGAYSTGYNDDAYGMELGLDAEEGDYTLTVTNSGVVLAENQYGDAFGIKAETYADGDLTISNVGVYSEYGALVGGIIRAESQESDTDGIHAYHYGNGDIVVSNSGLISSETYSGYGDMAIGVDMHHYGAGDIRLTNNGVIEATASVSGDAWGIHADTQEGTGNVFITNDYYIEVAADDDAKGIQVDAESDVTVMNFYGIDVHAWDGTATGIEVNATNDSVVDVRNRSFSDIWSYSSNGDAIGIDVYVDMDAGLNDGASVNVLNSLAGITVKGEDDATGIRVRIEEGSIYVPTQGFICANVAGCNGLDGYSANGEWVVTQYGYTQDGEGSAPVTVSNTGFIDVFSRGYGDAIGIDVDMGNGNEGELATITNSGIIKALSNNQQAYGIKSVNDFGDTSIANTGWIYAEGWDDAFGINAESNDGGNITISNSRLIVAEAGIDYAVGILASNNSGDISISNLANADVYVVGVDDAVGIAAWNNDGAATITNAGDVVVNSEGWTVGMVGSSDADTVSISNLVDGRVLVDSDYGTAYGVSAYTDHIAIISNAGTIQALTADGDAYGIYADADDNGTITVNQAATGRTVARSYNGDNDARGMNLFSDAGSITVTSAGVIGAESNGYDGYAMGIYAESDEGDITITNGAVVNANATGDYGDAIGIWAITNSGDISVSNSSNVLANATGDGDGWSVGIYTDNDTGATSITNSGNVRATGTDGDSWAIYHNGNSVSITNAAAGNIFGVIETDNAADTFTNNGDWYATEGSNFVSDFNDGNDAIVNNTGARIFMNDSVIDLGYAEGGVNSFMNNGKVFVSGADNVIDMGGATSVFTNNGASLHFEDGAANDALTVYGDFAGTGHIVVDANGTSMLADRLYIDGDVVSNTANVIDVYLSRNPTLEQITDGVEIDIVEVTGTSTAANFNLGIVDVDAEDTLYTVSHTLNKHINVSGTNPDLFALGFEISGLSQSGVAVSSIAPAVQNLWHLGTGTMFQRQGSAGGNATATGSAVKGFLNAADGGQVANYQGASGAWVRMFADNGGLTPDMGRDNFGTGGVQQFDLNSSGIEFGAGYAFNDQWTAGLLGGMSEASLKPQVGGRTKVDADTIGAYLTYTPGNGFYLDLSYRAMGFDGQGNGNGFRFEGDADGYSVELGYGFKTSGGLVIEPQFQFSSMDVSLDEVEYFDGDFDLTDGDSSQVRGSIALRKTYQSGAGEWTPFASFGVVNETNASNDYVIGGILTGNVDTSGNSTLVEAGATAHYGNMVFSGGVNWKDGGAYDSLFGGQVSVRFTW